MSSSLNATRAFSHLAVSARAMQQGLAADTRSAPLPAGYAPWPRQLRAASEYLMVRIPPVPRMLDP
jgi:hypothetical protein